MIYVDGGRGSVHASMHSSGARAKARDNDKARRFVVAYPDPTLPEKKGLVTIRYPARPSDVSRLACGMTNHSTARVISSSMRSRGIDAIP